MPNATPARARRTFTPRTRGSLLPFDPRRVEPSVTLPWAYSVTPKHWSGWRESNPLSHPPQGCMLPVHHTPTNALKLVGSPPILRSLGSAPAGACFTERTHRTRLKQKNQAPSVTPCSNKKPYLGLGTIGVPETPHGPRLTEFGFLGRRLRP